jgi:hypothetical protein
MTVYEIVGTGLFYTYEQMLDMFDAEARENHLVFEDNQDYEDQFEEWMSVDVMDYDIPAEVYAQGNPSIEFWIHEEDRRVRGLEH